MANEPAKNQTTPTENDALFPSLQREMNRLFDQFRSGFPGADALPGPMFGTGGFPAIDVVDTGDALEVTAEVPGVKEDDLDVSISGDVLMLKGEKSHDHEEKEENFHRIERRYGRFQRRIPLGFTPENGAVSADFTDGVLKLKIAKPAAAKAEVQKIDIKKS